MKSLFSRDILNLKESISSQSIRWVFGANNLPKTLKFQSVRDLVTDRRDRRRSFGFDLYEMLMVPLASVSDAIFY